MGAFDSLFRNLADSLITQFGGTGILRDISTSFTPATGLVVETPTDQTVSLSPPSPVELSAIDGTLVQEGDMTTLVAALGLTNVPVANETRLVFAGETWQVTIVDPIYSGDQVAAYQLGLRQ